MGSTIQIMVKHKYKCCLSENIDEVDKDEEDNDNPKGIAFPRNDRQIVKQLPALETDDTYLCRKLCYNNTLQF